MTEVKPITIQIRRPLNEKDLGEIAHGFYVFEDGIVKLTDQDGTPLKRGASQQLTTRTVKGAREAPVWSAAVLAGHDDRMVASRLLHTKVSSEKSGSDFSRPLRYPPLGLA